MRDPIFIVDEQGKPHASPKLRADMLELAGTHLGSADLELEDLVRGKKP